MNIIKKYGTLIGFLSIIIFFTINLPTDLYITGLSTFVGLTSALDVRVGAGLSVVGVSTFHSNITVAGLSTFTGISTFGSAVHVGGALDVIGISTFKGNIDANGALDVDGQTDLDVLNVSDTATFAAGLVANGDVDLSLDLSLDFSLDLSSDLIY